jgi:acetyltransferase
MRRIIDYARSRGIGEIFGDVLRENTAMLRLCDTLGFTRSFQQDEPSVIRVTLNLQE